MVETLDSHQIEAAIQFVDEHWAESDRLLLPAERDEWAGALAYVFPGELKPVIQRWSTTTRPSANAVLDYILTNRDRPVVHPVERKEPDLGGKVTPVVAESIAEARAALKKRLVSCSPAVRG
jgi:hypothetical protein